MHLLRHSVRPDWGESLVKEPQHGKLISECCSALPFMDIDPEWSSGCETWIGMCGRCKEHSDFRDETIVDYPGPHREPTRKFTPEQERIITRHAQEAMDEQEGANE
jgi:hypothetical protein